MSAMSLTPFNGFLFDDANECLWRGKRPIHLRPKTFAVLRHLVRNAGRLVTKEDLLGTVWPESFVCDASLKVCIREIRHALGDDCRRPRFIETVHRRGYRFIARPPEDGGAADLPACGPASQPPPFPLPRVLLVSPT